MIQIFTRLLRAGIRQLVLGMVANWFLNKSAFTLGSCLSVISLKQGQELRFS